MKILIFGKGYLGTRCARAWKDAVLSDVFVTDVSSAHKEIQTQKPDVVLNAAGVKGSPNVDWCETNQLETIRGNTLLPLALAEACAKAGVYFLHLGSGCIFYGDSPHADKRWRENDFGNPQPVYSRTKWAADLCLSTLPNVGVARIRMPLDWIPAPGNLITKLVNYKKVIDVENSVTVIDDLLYALYQLMEKRADGIFHVTNPGTIKHKEILNLYREKVDPSHTCEWIQNEDLVNLGLAARGRSNNFLASNRLAEFGIVLRPAMQAVTDTIEKYAKEWKPV
jgi:dTDP-4-dehydrorhamnose reductase